MHEQHRSMRIGEYIFDQPVAAARLNIRQAIKQTVTFRVFNRMREVALFLVAKRFSIADEKLKVAYVWLINMGIVNLIDDAMAQREPEAATCMISRPDAFFCTGRPAWLDPGRAKRYSTIRQIHFERGDVSASERSASRYFRAMARRSLADF